MDETGKGLFHFADKSQLLPQEEMLEEATAKKKLTIGIPKEVFFNEARVPLVPEGVHLLVEHGHKVVIEEGAGLEANFTDSQYADAGAVITGSVEETFQSDIIVKIAPPTLSELEYLTKNQTLLSSVFLTHQSKEYFTKLLQKRVTAIAYENIHDCTGALPLVR